jgi:hypothetical protein
MERLSNDWLTQGLIDFEYKKYILLAYLKHVKTSFDRVELYPYMADLVFHYRNLLSIRDNKVLIRESFPRELSLEDFKKLEISYHQLINDDDVMSELESILEFSIPQIKDYLQEGSVIFEYVESNCEIAPIGVTPLYANEGYLVLTQPPQTEAQVYRYQVSIFEDAHEEFRSLNTHLIETIPKSKFVTYESIKLDLIRRYKDLPNPATYLFTAKVKFPFNATLMPVAKRLFIRHITRAA